MTKRRVRVGVRGRVALAAVAVLLAWGGAYLWLRDSSLVAVRRVSVSGLSGPDSGQIRSALILAARNMTTLDVRLGQLRTAVAPYPVVKDLRVSTQFPHGMRIGVVEQLPVGALVAGGRTVPASADGTLLHDVPGAPLPTVPVPALPGGSRVSDPAVLEALSLLAATPPRLRRRIAQVSDTSAHGLVVQLRSGPSVYFGDANRLEAKWIAATEVLADSSSAGASYIDVTDPARPVAGVGAQAVAAAGLATTGPQTTGSTVGSTTGSAVGSTTGSAVGSTTGSTAGATTGSTSSSSSAQAAPNSAGGG